VVCDEYRIRRSARAKHLRIAVGLEGVEVVVPRGVHLDQARRYVEKQRDWIQAKQAQLKERASFWGPRAQLTDGGVLPYLGQSLTLKVDRQPSRRRTAVRFNGSTVSVSVNEADRDTLRTICERWYRQRARLEVASRLDEACKQAGLAYSRLTIRSQKTRWASCSPRGEMSFNWRLLLGPAQILDYVVWHEVCHLEVADHSPDFHKLLHSRMPNYREHEHWLRNYGQFLFL
jgi:predicted metal-dependent hydrolase